MEPRNLPKTRNTTVHRHPVLAFQMDRGALYNPLGPLDLRDHGLDRVADVDAWEVLEGLEAKDSAIDVYVDRDRKNWLCYQGGNQPVLIPCPFERVPYDVGDRFYVVHPLRYEPACSRTGKPRYRLGEVTAQFPLEARFGRDFTYEHVKVKWQSEDWPLEMYTRDIALCRGESLLYPPE